MKMKVLGRNWKLALFFNFSLLVVIYLCLFSGLARYNCRKNITLPYFDTSSSEKYQVFFLETSGWSYLKGRQVCSIESAATKSGLVSKVIIKSSYLDLSKSRALCDVYHNYEYVDFYTINNVDLFRRVAVSFFKFSNWNFSFETVWTVTTLALKAEAYNTCTQTQYKDIKH